MSIKILVVEDQFIEANDLSVILKKAGHTVSGIAKSVDQAFGLLKRERPDMVLLDIYLKGDLTGIHLAKYLSNNNIPFIYLSANSNPSTLEAAKATRPYGFLVKPFREKDILVALDIASYRHKHTQELMARQEQWLSTLLGSIINEVATHEQKLLLLVKAFKHFIPFDHLFIDADSNSGDPELLYGFQRIDFDDYQRMDMVQFLKKARLDQADLDMYRRGNDQRRELIIRNGADFNAVCFTDKVSDRIRKLYGIQSSLTVPISLFRESNLSITFFSVRPDGFNTDQVDLLSPLRGLLATVIDNIRVQKSGGFLTVSEMEGGEKKQQMHIEGVVGKSPKLLHVLDQVVQVAGFDTTVLISGETGVGKEGLANALHRLSQRKGKPFIKVNCAAIPDSLIESELFGHERGAFTNAMERRIGKFEQANGGTIFLDEIGELPLPVQSKLLRVLQEKEVQRIGGVNTFKTDVRIIVATNRNLHVEVTEGRFRMDLYYRINVFPISVPPLRQRVEDIPLLAKHFLQQIAVVSGLPVKELSPEVMRRLMGYSWPGNIRELQHLLERHVIISGSRVISSIELPDDPLAVSPAAVQEETPLSTDEEGREHIVAALKKCNGKVSGKGGAAEALGVNPNTLTSRMKKLGITWKYILQ